MAFKDKQVRVFAPASIGNIAAGFDVLGAAIAAPGDIVIARRIPNQGFTFSLQRGSTPVPTTSANVAAHVARLILDEVEPSFGIALTLHKKMPVGSGLGSSGASSAAAAFAVNELLGKPFTKPELLRFAVEGERLASGSPHADNVAPSLLGGICLIHSTKPLDVIKLPAKNNFYWVVVHPHIIIETRNARSILPKSLPLSDVSAQIAYASGLVLGLTTGDKELVGKSIKDIIAEPVRRNLIPGFAHARADALQAGALGFSISGSGPSVFAVTTSLKIADKVGRAISKALSQHGKIKCGVYISKINQQGAKIIGK